MPVIHPSSIIDPKAIIADDVQIGPFCIVGPNVTIGAGTVLMSHVTVDGVTVIGQGNKIYSGAAIGCEPQDKKYRGEPTRLVIGDRNVIRENCTISTGTIQDEGITTVGNDNLFMANVHIAHDCRIGNSTILANNFGAAGHCHIEDGAVIGGQSGMHQFVHVGKHAMVGGASAVLRDVPPYVICSGNPAAPRGLNLVGLRRWGFSPDLIHAIKDCYRAIYREGMLVSDSIAEIEEIIARSADDIKPYLEHMKNFVANSPRGIIR